MDAQSWQTRPTVIEGLRRRTRPAHHDHLLFWVAATSSTDASPLYASCVDCGSHAPQWRRLIGAGARFEAAPGNAGRMVVRSQNACGVCGSDTLIVTAR